MELIESKEVIQQINNYPKEAREKLLELRDLIITTAQTTDGVKKLLETRKWGEPSYLSKSGSTIRIDWKEKTPDKCYVYFICTTELVSTFRFLFGDELSLEANRSIVLNLKEPLPKQNLARCFQLALTYHKVKHLPLLGV